MITKRKVLRLATVGDLLLSSKPNHPVSGRGLEALSDEIQQLFSSCDLVFANLECTLPHHETVPTEPRVTSNEEQIRSLQHSGIDIVTLGNNHTFDSLDTGFNCLRNVLSDLQIPYFGAGKNIEEALQPVIIEVGGISLAFLGGVDKSSGPFRFAGEATSGVAPLDTEKICSIINELRQKVNHVVVSPHWGEERFQIPSPEQIITARTFIDAGASLVLGHHPHVLQGMEIYRDSPIVYSLGNFIANDVYWEDGDFFTWNRFERTGCIFVAELDENGVHNVQQIPTFDDGQTVRIDKTGWGDHCIEKANRLLARGVSQKNYSREKFRVQVLKPVFAHLRWSELHRIRPKHFLNFCRLLVGKKV